MRLEEKDEVYYPPVAREFLRVVIMFDLRTVPGKFYVAAENIDSDGHWNIVDQTFIELENEQEARRKARHYYDNIQNNLAKMNRAIAYVEEPERDEISPDLNCN